MHTLYRSLSRPIHITVLPLCAKMQQRDPFFSHTHHLPHPGRPGVINACLISHYFTVKRRVSEGTLLSNAPFFVFFSFCSFSLTHTHLFFSLTPTPHTCNHIVTHSSKMTAQSGRKRRCVRPAPCIPIKMSELWVIFSCTRNGTSLKDRHIIYHPCSLSTTWEMQDSGTGFKTHLNL